MKKLLILVPIFIILSYAKSTQPNIRADVQAVNAQERNGVSSFSVTLNSVETGCKQYADWWEVLDKNGALLYRRILVHSHPDTQPFTRSGSFSKISKDATVYVRAHMNSVGYVGDVFVGSMSKGFKKLEKPVVFSEKIESQKPLPLGCLF